MLCMGRRGGGEVQEIHGVEIKRRRKQFQGRMEHKAICQNSTEENKRRYGGI